MSRINYHVLATRCHSLLAVFFAMILSAGCHKPAEPTQAEVIEGDSLDRVDFEKMGPSVRLFVLRAAARKTIGKPVSDFGDLLSHADNSDLTPSSRFRNYSFFLPLKEEAILSNADANREGGVPYIVSMGISVELENQTVQGVYIAMLGL